MKTLSLRDPSGCVFTVGDTIYRALRDDYEPSYEMLMQSGLYDKLVYQGLLIPHVEVDDKLEIVARADQAKVTPRTVSQDNWLRSRIIMPERVEFISYPYEWCFSQLKAAALATLRAERLSLEFNMSLKDASAYNIQFHKGRALLIDTGSFEHYREGKPWVAYSQFIRHFLAPLTLMAKCSPEMNKLALSYTDGIPIELACELLPWHTWLNPSLAVHLLGNKMARKASQDKKAGTEANIKMPKEHLIALLDDLESVIERLILKSKRSTWSHYYQDNSYSSEAASSKEKLVSNWVDELNPKSVWDIGANNGYFSKLCADKNIFTMSLDADIRCVEDNFCNAQAENQNKLMPLVLDLTVPTPSAGWSNRERLGLASRGPAELILALALIHHLAIAQNIPLKEVAAYFAELGQNLIIEFVPKEDVQVQRLLALRDDVFDRYDQRCFEEYFSRSFDIVKKETIGDSGRILYLMQVKK
ncbi:MAG: SAM-dependent methyltransferase [Candidatus Melainabacteria bacterium]|nr:MAG: SAM-dependent methyltransferase [Candidatus Melainabacteria bacterium]